MGVWWKREVIEPVVLCLGALEGQFAMARSLAAWYCSWVVVEDKYRHTPQKWRGKVGEPQAGDE